MAKKKVKIIKVNLKKFPVFDFVQATDLFVDQLEKLEAHIRAHKMHVGWRRDADEIKKARTLYKKYKNLSITFEMEQQLIEEFFEYVAKRILKWWC